MSEKIICRIYRSERREGSYLYTRFSDELSAVPEALLKPLQPLVEAMSLTLEPQRKLAHADVLEVMAALRDKGYYLQWPPAEQQAASRAGEVPPPPDSLHG